MSSLKAEDDNSVIMLSPPPKWRYDQPDPVFWRSPLDGKSYIIFALGAGIGSDEDCLYRYDFEKDAFTEYLKYPSGHSPSHHCMALDPISNTLFIVDRNAYVFRANLTANNISVDSTPSDGPVFSMYSANAFFFESEVHIFQNGKHFSFDPITCKWKDRGNFDDNDTKGRTQNGTLTVFAVNEQRLVMVDNKKRVWFRGLPNRQWRLSDIELPSEIQARNVCFEQDIKVVTVHNFIVLAINVYAQTACFADFGVVDAENANTCKWTIVPLEDAFPSADFCFVLVIEDMLYVMTVWEGDNNFFGAMPLSQILPVPLLEKYTVVLMNGAFREFARDNQARNIPEDIKQLIFKFYA